MRGGIGDTVQVISGGYKNQTSCEYQKGERGLRGAQHDQQVTDGAAQLETPAQAIQHERGGGGPAATLPSGHHQSRACCCAPAHTHLPAPASATCR